MRLRAATFTMLVCATATGGCAHSKTGTLSSMGTKGQAVETAQRAPDSDAAAANTNSQLAAEKRRTTSDPQALAEVVAQLQSVGALSPEAQERLMEDLKQTDPALWPQLVQSFRATLAYRQQLEEKIAAETVERHERDRPLRDIAQRRAEPPREKQAGLPPERLAPRIAEQPGVRIQPVVATDYHGAPSYAVQNAAPQPAVPQNITQQFSGPPLALPYPIGAPGDALAKESPRSPAVFVTPIADASGSPASRVVPASHEAPSASDRRTWQAQLSATIAALEQETRQPPANHDEVLRHVHLRMMYLAAGRRDDALKPIAGLPAAQQDFWSKQIFGLATYFDTTQLSDPARRASEASGHLAAAATRLAETGLLTVRNVAFCSEVNSYGVYKKFDKAEFKPDQAVILYAEVENFRSEPSEKGYHTSLKSSYQVLDSQGNRVAEQEFPATEEHCQNIRRDFFIRLVLRLPRRLNDGRYTLQLTIEDTKSQKLAQSSIAFTVKDAR